MDEVYRPRPDWTTQNVVSTCKLFTIAGKQIFYGAMEFRLDSLRELDRWLCLAGPSVWPMLRHLNVSWGGLRNAKYVRLLRNCHKLQTSRMSIHDYNGTIFDDRGTGLRRRGELTGLPVVKQLISVKVREGIRIDCTRDCKNCRALKACLN